jgi:hypothetical protein
MAYVGWGLPTVSPVPPKIKKKEKEGFFEIINIRIRYLSAASHKKSIAFH